MSEILIPIETYKCLREHLEMANELFKSLGGELKSDVKSKALKLMPKETKIEREARYRELIESSSRAKKPNYLKK